MIALMREIFNFLNFGKEKKERKKNEKRTKYRIKSFGNLKKEKRNREVSKNFNFGNFKRLWVMITHLSASYKYFSRMKYCGLNPKISYSSLLNLVDFLWAHNYLISKAIFYLLNEVAKEIARKVKRIIYVV